MSHRMVRTAFTVLATVTALVATSAPASANVLVDQVVRIAGEYGATVIGAERFAYLDELVYHAQDPAALISSLPENEKIAMLYNYNPRAITEIQNSAALGTDCDENPRECAEGAAGPSTPQPYVGKPEPSPDPTRCAHHDREATARSLINKPVYTFKATFYYCIDGVLVQHVSAGGGYDVFWPGWHCVASETPSIPIVLILPPPVAPSPSSKATVQGECKFEIGFSVGGKSFGVSGQHTFPDAELVVAGDGTGYSDVSAF